MEHLSLTTAYLDSARKSTRNKNGGSPLYRLLGVVTCFVVDFFILYHQHPTYSPTSVLQNEMGIQGFEIICNCLVFGIVGNFPHFLLWSFFNVVLHCVVIGIKRGPYIGIHNYVIVVQKKWYDKMLDLVLNSQKLKVCRIQKKLNTFREIFYFLLIKPWKEIEKCVIFYKENV